MFSAREQCSQHLLPQRTAAHAACAARCCRNASRADELRASCPAQIGETPTARLDAMNNRLDAMVQAVKTLRPTLGTFYASLNDEQKALFNSMGQQNATPQENATGGRQE